MTADCRDHVIPVSYLSISRSWNSDYNWLVPSCSICNMLAGSKVFFSIPEKAEFILKRFKVKYRKILNRPEWEEKDLNALDYNLRKMIWGGMVAKRVALEKVNFLEKTTKLPIDWERPDFVNRQIREITEELQRLNKKFKKRKKLKNAKR